MKTVIVFLAVLAVAVSSVSADEGWILWTHSMWSEKGIDFWTPTGSTTSLEECQAVGELGLRNSARKATGTARVTHEGLSLTMHFPSGDRASILAVCMPASIDPRPREAK